MLDLLFLTGNRTKLCHARHMAIGCPVRIESIKQRSYNKSYVEPRLDLRKELLKQSYTSALEQSRKAGWNIRKNFFFLEDTSVIIDALSQDGEEIPGVDIKYWMRSHTFYSLDALLQQHGNNRKVTVRSDILLHIPDTYREKLSLEKPYLIFTSSQSGLICDKEHTISTNLIFPWLDNKTFNKWFVPDGAEVPISLLPIKEADKYDFRRKAFMDMVDSIKKLVQIPEVLAFDFASIGSTSTLVVCSFTCAGKTTIAQHLIKKFGYFHIEASDFMYWNCYMRHGVNPDINIGDFAEQALKEIPHIVSEKIAEYISKEKLNVPIIISGFRAKEEIDWLIDHYPKSKEIGVVVIDAPQSTRFDRHNARNRENALLSLEDFVERDKQQKRMGISDIFNYPNCRKVFNDSSFDTFFETFENSIISGQSPSSVQEMNLECLRDFSGNLKFEEIILLALLDKWEKNEDHEYFTTAAIAKISNKLFPLLRPKHKDNVSRYFNQDFYPFYEIYSNPDENKNKYRLSNTGYSRAILAYYKAVQQLGDSDSVPLK